MMFISELFSNDLVEESARNKKDNVVPWLPVDTIQKPMGTSYSPKNKYIGNPDYNTRKDTKTAEGSIIKLPTSWNRDNKYQGKQVRMNHREAHKIMSPEEYLEIRHQLGSHEFDPNVGGEQGTVGIRYTGPQTKKIDELIDGYPS